MKVAEGTSSVKPMLASKVEAITSNKGKEVARSNEGIRRKFEKLNGPSDPKPMQTSEDEQLDSVETNDEPPIEFGSVPKDFFGEYSFNTTYDIHSQGRPITSHVWGCRGDDDTNNDDA